MSQRWRSRQLEHYASATEGKTDPVRYQLFVTKYLGPPPLGVLDVGCAGGDITYDLMQRGYDVVGVDYPEIIERTSRKYPGLRLVAWDVNDGLDFSKEWFDPDWIYASEILEHIPHDFNFLSSCYEYLKVGGRIYVTVPRQAEKWQAHLRHYPEESLRNLLWAAGFDDITVDRTYSSLIAVGVKKQ